MRNLLAVMLGLGLTFSASACGSHASCADAVKKMEALDPDSAKETADELAKDIDKHTQRCIEEKTKPETLDCVVKAADYKTARACLEADKGK